MDTFVYDFDAHNVLCPFTGSSSARYENFQNLFPLDDYNVFSKYEQASERDLLYESTFDNVSIQGFAEKSHVLISNSCIESLTPVLKENFHANRCVSLRPLQKYMMSLSLADLPYVATGKRGSGKTFAYLLPLLNYVSNHQLHGHLGKTERPLRAIIAVFDEPKLIHVESQLKRLTKGARIYFNTVRSNVAGLSEGTADILLGTVSGICDYLTVYKTISLKEVHFLILDEFQYASVPGNHEKVEKLISHFKRRGLHLPRQTNIIMEHFKDSTLLENIVHWDHTYITYSVPHISVKVQTFEECEPSGMMLQSKMHRVVSFINESSDKNRKVFILTNSPEKVGYISAYLTCRLQRRIWSLTRFSEIPMLEKDDLEWRSETAIVVLEYVLLKRFTSGYIGSCICFDLPLTPVYKSLVNVVATSRKIKMRTIQIFFESRKDEKNIPVLLKFLFQYQQKIPRNLYNAYLSQL